MLTGSWEANSFRFYGYPVHGSTVYGSTVSRFIGSSVHRLLHWGPNLEPSNPEPYNPEPGPSVLGILCNSRFRT